MRAVLCFKLPAEHVELNAAMQGSEAKAVMWDIDQYCRGICKPANRQRRRGGTLNTFAR